MKKLRMEMRVGERRPISDFDLAKGETLEQRVKKELAEASERGDLGGMGVKASIPSIAVFETDDEGEAPAGSIALFNAAGKEVTYRDIRVEIGEDSHKRNVIRVTGTDTVHEGGEEKDEEVLIGVFYDEELARRVGSLWKAGVLD